MSIRLQADKDLRYAILTGVRRREPAIDFQSAVEGDLDGLSDPEVLELAAISGRVVVSHDRSTMIDHFNDRLKQGRSTPGLLVVSQGTPIGLVVESIVYAWALLDESELRDAVLHLPSLSRHVFPR